MTANRIIKIWLTEGNRLERIWLLAQIEFKLRYYGNRLGLLWALINPLSQILMFYLVFQVLMGQKIENYAIYVFSGLFVWIFFTDCTNRSIGILRSQRQLYENTDMSKLEIYIAQHLSATIGFLFNFGIFIIGALVSGILPSWHYVYFIIIYLNLLILTFGVSLILSNLFLFFNDINQIWNIVVRFGFFLSPILFRGDLFAEKVPFLNYANPISGIINNTREVLLFKKSPDWQMMGFDFVYALVILGIGLILLKKLSPKASELV